MLARVRWWEDSSAIEARPGREMTAQSFDEWIKGARLEYFHSFSSPCPTTACAFSSIANCGRPLGLASRRTSVIFSTFA